MKKVEKELDTLRVKSRSLLKYIFVGNFAFFYPMIQLMAFFADSENIKYTWQGKPLYGWEAILSAPLFGLMIAGMITMLTWVGMGLGMRIWSKFGAVKLKYYLRE